jgi:hypothetical protein
MATQLLSPYVSHEARYALASTIVFPPHVFELNNLSAKRVMNGTFDAVRLRTAYANKRT